MNESKQHIRLLSVVIPVFNEEKTVTQLLDKVREVKLTGSIPMEIVVIDDSSTDSSASLVEQYIIDHKLSDETMRHVVHKINEGKGAAVRTSIAHVRGDYVLVQDADLELDPQEYNILLAPVLADEADIVFGSRFLEHSKQPAQEYSHYLANKVITWIGNVLTGLRLTDLQTCYKLIPTQVFKSLTLTENRFAFDPEITMRLAKIKNMRWREVPITYEPRTVHEGKKLGYVDGLRAIYSLVKYRLKS